VREEEWRTFQPLVNLAESEVWNWHPNTHDTLLSQFFRLSGTVLTPSGILVYPHVSKNITCIAPREPADLTNYLNVITSHNLMTPGGRLWKLVRLLSQTAARHTWDWVEGEHQGALDTLQEATGVLLTLEGPFCPTRGQVLRSSRPSSLQQQASQEQCTIKTRDSPSSKRSTCALRSLYQWSSSSRSRRGVGCS
jgi:hypothetical protein